MNFRKGGIIIFVLLLAGLFLLNRKDVQMIAQDQFELQTIASNGVELQSTIRLNNPNLLSSTIKNIHEKFYVNGNLLGILDNELNQGIPGRKETDFPVNIRFAKDDLNKALLPDSAATTVKIDIEGEITFQNLVGGGSIKIHTSAFIADYKP